MMRLVTFLIAALGILPFVTGISLWAAQPAVAQNDEADAWATVATLETRVAELETQIAEGERPGTERDEGDVTPQATRTIPSETEPIMLADGLELLYYYFVESGTYWHDRGDKTTFVFGEMRNTTDQAYTAPQIRFVLIDDDQTVVGEIIGFPIVSVIFPGETLPFQSAVFGREPRLGEWTSERIELDGCWGCDFVVAAALNNQVEMRDVEVSGSGESFQVTGTLYNGGSEPVQGPQVYLALYLPDGRFTGSIRSIPPQTALQPGESVRFQIPDALYPLDALGLAGPDFSYELWQSR